MRVAVIEYNAGNAQSVLFALERLGVNATLTADIETISSADRVIFPGVGEASSTMRYLRAKGLAKLIPQLKQPLLGICLGLQLLCTYSEENNTECLGIFPLSVKKFHNNTPGQFKIPHMGWNSLFNMSGPLFKNIQPESQVYFVHSYAAELGPDTSARCDYIHEFSAAINKDNFYAVQFHPEKSSSIGEQILKNFLTV